MRRAGISDFFKRVGRPRQYKPCNSSVRTTFYEILDLCLDLHYSENFEIKNKTFYLDIIYNYKIIDNLFKSLYNAQ